MSIVATYHTPVMLHECIEALNIKPDGIYVDVTFGGGGHSRAILEKLGPKGKLIGFDQDDDVKNNLPDDARFIWVNHNFRFLKNFLKLHHINAADGILADLGVSSHQFDEGSRGFSYRSDALLDMRMDQQSKPDARGVVNTYTEEQLIHIFKSYGELKNSRKVAQTIIDARTQKSIETINHFLKAIERVTPFKDKYTFLSQVFQAIRMEVNKELDVLGKFLNDTTECLSKGGRLVVMSYHSLEDRLVKSFIASGNTEGHIVKDVYGNSNNPLKALSRAIAPSDEEIEKNPRSRSAKLRIAEKL